jgi:hypothetical protein
VKKVLIILFLMMIALSGCSSPTVPKENAQPTDKQDSLFSYAKPLTLEEVKNAIILEGLQLSENQEEDSNEYAIDNVSPAIYTTKPNNNILMIYIYDSIALRTEACRRGEMGNDALSQLPEKENWFTKAYTAKNVLIVNMCDIENFQSNATVWRSLGAAADSLNDIKELVFTDKGSYWDANLVINYYQHWYKDKKDVNNLDKYAKKQWHVKYLGSDPESVHLVKYEYTSNFGSGGSGTVSMKKIGNDYFLDMGSGGNSIPVKDEVYTLTIQWGDKKESLYLKTINQE